jgi:hypothetical protein
MRVHDEWLGSKTRPGAPVSARKTSRLHGIAVWGRSALMGNGTPASVDILDMQSQLRYAEFSFEGWTNGW